MIRRSWGEITDPFDGVRIQVASEVVESERPAYSQLLGPDGHPLQYEPRMRIGFDLSVKRVKA